MISILIQSSCSIEKRKYRPGYHIEFNNQKYNHKRSFEELNIKSETIHEILKANPIEKTLAENEPVASISQLKIAKLKYKILRFIESERCDTLSLQNGQTIPANILEFNSELIRYKDCDNLDGPTILIKTSDLKSIKYANGHTEHLSRAGTVQNNSSNETQSGGEFGLLSFISSVLFIILLSLGSNALVLLLIPAAIIFGIMGLSPKRKFKGFAMAGLVIAGVFILLFIIALISLIGTQ